MCRSCDALHPVLSGCSCPRRRRQGLLAVFFYFFFPSSVTRGQEIWAWPWAHHISAPWMSWLCAEAQTVGYQIRTQGLLFQSTFFFSHRHVSHSFLSFCLALILSLARGFPPLPSLPDSLPSPCEDGGLPRVPRLRNQRGGLFRQPGKFLLLHLSKSPLHLSNRVWDWRSWPDWACSRFSTQMTGIARFS